ncbi:FlaA1/EpsC-like NDP-sugar epimerase [Bacillus pakistanensis]|uniref:FlaA1/EpsC-like NDP-sugar epimerase n=1 Tax=Rossellomorea pakistanensis TaxID=992288 RepID=A0ABS2NH36_9BACI|nr:FlaA1/EpsC-like NDP-sugar epimerase [Bacillus pakistanensis]
MPSSQKKQSFTDGSKDLYAYGIIALFSSLVGTYLDLIFVGKGMYHFPVRLFPEIFPINILFTLLILPLFTVFFLFVAKRIQPVSRFIMILMISFIIVLIEQITEQFGWFIHHKEWKHSYSFWGYMFFLFGVWKIYFFLSRK